MAGSEGGHGKGGYEVVGVMVQVAPWSEEVVVVVVVG